MQDTLIDQGLNLMLFGMGTVFVFLTILVFATIVMSTLVNRFAPATKVEQAPSQAPPIAANSPLTVSPHIVSAIEKAVAAHRQR
ncbi:MAG: oxaloacetate decarboxylase gamma subunit [Arenicella sp.]|jgi:oxaloacetate decarboxylase gamma subunit